MSAPVTELVELTETDPMLREINRGLMVHWINADLALRSCFDVRTSTVLYDDAKVFAAVLPPALGERPDATLTPKLIAAGIRYVSTGIV